MFALFADVSLSSDEDEEGSSNQCANITKRQLRNSIDIMNMPNTEFQNNFRMNKATFTYIFGEIACYLAETHRGIAVTKIIKLATVLRFLATGVYQRGIGNEYMSSLSQSKVSEAIEECLEVMEQHLCSKWIKFDVSVEEERNTKMKFVQKYNIPGVIGCVDGTHIKIMTPSKDIAHLYRNRKGYYSLNTMMICDSDLVIKYVDTRHPGANHDAFVWSTSEADEYLKIGHMNGKANTWLLGDGGYQCLPYLLTPYRNPSTEQQIKFNSVLTRARNPIERCYGVLKNRFRCLIAERGLHCTPDKAKKIVNVCSALHNICIFFKNEWPPLDAVYQEYGDESISLESSNLILTGQNIRNLVANSL